jgi:hypothetical protein
MIGSRPAETTPGNNPPFIAQEFMHRRDWKVAVIGTLNALLVVLAVRLTLLVAVVGAFALAYLSVQNADPFRAGVLLIYSAVVVVPLIWLAARH